MATFPGRGLNPEPPEYEQEYEVIDHDVYFLSFQV
jgi:hypothetical protein